MPLPSALTIQSGINKLRYATLIGIKQAKNKPLKKISLAEVQNKLGANLSQIEKLYVPVKQKKTEMLDGSPAEIAKALVEKLRNEVRAFYRAARRKIRPVSRRVFPFALGNQQSCMFESEEGEYPPWPTLCCRLLNKT